MIKLTNRLQQIADLVKKGDRIVDVGCDHGYIPVYLVKNGICPSAIACDINEGPMKSCCALVYDYHLGEKIQCILTDGLDNISADDYDTVILAGMGGELISDILSRSDCITSKRLILNPMTHPEIARKFLYDNGFEIEEDVVVSDGRHHYSVFAASYSGCITEKTEIDYFLGNIQDFSDKEYFFHLLNYLKNKQKSGMDYSSLIKEIEDRI